MIRTLSALALALSAVPAQAAWHYCESNHGTGYVWFDPSAGRAQLYLDGRGTFHDGVSLKLDLDCSRDRDSSRPRWECDEPAPYRHPDGQMSLGIEVSYEYYLMVATRHSAEYRAEIGVDDFTCYQ